MINPNKKRKQHRINKLLVGENYIENDYDITDYMNNYFCTIGKELAKDIPTGKDYHSYLSNKNPVTFSLSPISESEITNEIMKLNSKKCPGPDNISPKILKYCEPFICKPLSVIFNSSIWKQLVTPLNLKLLKYWPYIRKKAHIWQKITDQ